MRTSGRILPDRADTDARSCGRTSFPVRHHQRRQEPERRAAAQSVRDQAACSDTADTRGEFLSDRRHIREAEACGSGTENRDSRPP